MSQADKQGPAKSFFDVHGKYRVEVYQYFLRVVEDQETAEDLTMEAFLNAFLQWDQVRDRKDIETWLRVLVANHAENWKRESCHSRRPPTGYMERLERIIAALPEEYRSIFRMAQELSDSETRNVPG